VFAGLFVVERAACGGADNAACQQSVSGWPRTGDVRAAGDHQAHSADWTAITGIVVSGLVGPATLAGLGAWWADRRSVREHEYARVLTDRAELRQLLDEAGQAMRWGERLGSVVPGLFMTYGPRIAEMAETHMTKFHSAMRDIDRQGVRLALRLGSNHPVASTYREAFDSLVTIVDAVDIAGVEGGPNRQQTDADMRDGYANAKAADERFLSFAKELVASQLAPRQRGRAIKAGLRSPT
jgi:hypothetical protein